MNYRPISLEGYRAGSLGKGNIYTGYTIESIPQKVLLQKQDKDNNLATADDIWVCLSVDSVRGLIGTEAFFNEKLDLSGFRNVLDEGTDRSGVTVEGATALPKLYTGQAFGSIAISGVTQSDIEKFYFLEEDNIGNGGTGLVNTLVVKNDAGGNYIVQNGTKKYFIDLNGDKKLTNSLEGYLGDIWAWIKNNPLLFGGLLFGAWRFGLLNWLWSSLGIKGLIVK
jgi:hypothetical protein